MNRFYTSIIILMCSFSLLGQNTLIKKFIASPDSKTVAKKLVSLDFENDGDKDLIGMEILSKGLLLYKNNAGIIDSVPLFFPQDSIVDFIVEDWNNDGLKDLISLNYIGNLYLYTNLGASGLATPVLMGSSGISNSGVIELKAVNINNDAFTDLCVSGTKIIQNNAGSSTIPAPTILGATFSTFNAIEFYDFNSDGLIDIVAPYDDGTNYCLGIYECTGGYNYSATPYSIIIGSHASSIGWISFVKMEDMDNVPGKEIVCQTGGYNTFVIKQNGIYSFTNYNLGTSSYTNTATGLNPPNGTSGFSAFTDIDNNGLKDVVVNNSVFFQNSVLSFTRVNIMASPDIYYMRFVCDDFDGNASKELWYNNGELTTHHSLYKIVSINCNAGQTFGAKQNKWFMHPIIGHPLVDDFDNDNNYDMVYQSSGHIALSKKQGAAYIEKNILNGQYTFIDKIDLDNNGLTDLICQEDAFYNSQQRLRYLKNLGAGNFQDMGSIFNNGGNYYKVIATSDFDNDGDQDLFFLRQAGGYMKVSHYSNVSGTLTLQAEYDPIVSSGFDAAQGSFENAYGVVADMNNDGFKDLVVYYYKDAGTTYLCVFKNNNGVSFTRQYSTFINESLAIGASDLTGDGLPDIICTLSNQLKYLKNNGNFSFSVTPILPAITSVFYNEIFSLIDVNSDNLADIVNEDEGVISVAINQISAFSSITPQGSSNSHTSFLDGYMIGNTGHGISRANSWFDWYDYDSDGDNDIFIPENYNYVWENTSNSIFSIVGNFFYDFNGDGLKNGSDVVISNTKLGIGSIQNYAYTTNSGSVTLPMGGYSGSFNVQSYSPYNSTFNFTTTHPAVATINNSNPSDTVNLGVQQTNPVINNHDNAISSHRCNEGARFWTSFNSISPYNTAGKLTLHYPTSLNYVAASTNPTNFSAGAITWNINNISPYSNNGFWTDFIMPNYTFMGDTLTFYSELKTWFGSDTATTVDTFRTILTCAYDPNNKHIELNNSVIKGDKLYSIGDDIEYIINFQNTGNDTASNVIIKDFIPSEFDYNSLEFVSASNSCSVSLNNNGLFTATFLNINLPDSSASFINSMGYVKFKLKLKNTAPHNVAINNSARIFFDLNPPILTNTEAFYRVDCKFFASPVNASTSCANTSNTSYVLTHNISPSTYVWKLDGLTVSINDTANYYISTTGNHTLSLNVTNAICNVDSTRTWNISNAAPNLNLNFTGDTIICPNGSVYLSSLYNCQWYVNGTLNSTGYNFFGQAGQTITVNNTTGLCIRHDTITISQHNIPTNIINESVNNNLISFCSGNLDTIHLSTSVTSGFYWDYYDDNNDVLYYTSNVSIYPNLPSNTSYIGLVFDTLGCTIYEEVVINIVNQIDLSLSASPDFYINCVPGNTNLELESLIPSYIDSVQIFHANLLQGTVYNIDESTSYYPITIAGNYTAIGYSACLMDTVNFTILDGNVPPIIVSNDSIFADNHGNYNWFYSVDSFSFSSVGTSPFLYSPPAGYYYFYYPAGCSTNYSDTIFYNPIITTTKPTNIDETINAVFNINNRELSVNNLNTENAVINVYDVSGKLISKRKLTQKQTIDNIDNGIYLLNLVIDERVLNIKALIIN